MQYLITFTYTDEEVFKEPSDFQFITNRITFQNDYIVIFENNSSNVIIFKTKGITNLMVKEVSK